MDLVASYRRGPVSTSMGEWQGVTVTLPGDVWSKLDSMARAQNISKASLLRPIIREFVERQGTFENGKPLKA